MTSKVKYGLIGCGNGGKSIANALLFRPDSKLEVIVSQTESHAKQFAKQFGVKKWGTEYNRLLNDETLDAICISTPDYLHNEMTIAALEAGKHVLCDKPMATTLEEADTMIKVSEKNSLKLGIISQKRFSAASKRLWEAVNSGLTGDLLFCEASVVKNRDSNYYNSSPWRKKQATTWKGNSINLSYHEIDLVRWFMGPLDKIWTKIFIMDQKEEIKDLSLSTVHFENGASGYIMTGSNVPQVTENFIKIGGTNGSVVLRDIAIAGWEFSDESMKRQKEIDPLRIYKNFLKIPILKHISRSILEFSRGVNYKTNLFNGRGFITKLIPGESKLHSLQIGDFNRAILEDERPFVDCYEGRNTLEFISKIYESAKSGQIIEN